MNTQQRISSAALAVVAALALTAPAAVRGGAPEPAAGNDPGGLARLAFIAGSWEADYNGRILHEAFSAPRAGTMIGMFRWIDEGATSFTEHLVIEERGDGIHLFVRHFHPGAVPWEAEQDGPMHFRLAEAEAGRAVFFAPERLFPSHVTYHRTQPDRLTVRLDGKREDGAPRAMEFNFRSTRMTISTATLTEVGQSLGYNGGLTIAFHVKDINKSIEWYQNVAGFKLMYHLEEMGWCELTSSVPNVNIGLSQVENPKTDGPVPTFGVNDIDHARAQLEGHGVRFDGPTQEIPGMVRLATFFDPDGNSLMLFQSLSDEMPQ
jgi:predicted enzyme related to lactoylglutathione lyase